MAFGLIIGIAYIATDDPHGYPPKATHDGIKKLQGVPGQRGRQPELSAGGIGIADIKTGRNRHFGNKRNGRDFAAAKPDRLLRSQVSRVAPNEFKPPSLAGLREVTAYNVGDPDQTYGDPCQSANGENICAALDSGSRRCAANFVPFGTRLHIDDYGVCTVTDRMHRRYSDRVDIAMKKDEKRKALHFGLRRLKVTVLDSSEVCDTC
jgi:3D (Asp-Asp-Asp) domain-containing protein